MSLSVVSEWVERRECQQPCAWKDIGQIIIVKEIRSPITAVYSGILVL